MQTIKRIMIIIKFTWIKMWLIISEILCSQWINKTCGNPLQKLPTFVSVIPVWSKELEISIKSVKKSN